jgi:hypothetical protein
MSGLPPMPFWGCIELEKGLRNQRDQSAIFSFVWVNRRGCLTVMGYQIPKKKKK